MILFLSKYPQTPEEYRDGFYQRVENVDRFFKDDKRVYLSVSLLKNFKRKSVKNGLREEINCNLILHFFLILILFKKSSIVYIQSIYNALYTIGFIYLLKNTYVLDLHGVVPEELEMQRKKNLNKIFSYVEKILFKKINICISVTNRMEKHFKKKYPDSNAKYMVYAILPSHLNLYEIPLVDNGNRRVEIIYSGNAQVWQNVDLMLSAIKNNISESIHYTILTGEPEIFKEKIYQLNIDSKNVTIKSVKPEELEIYYQNSHYGFVLRDDLLVNQVACPTKIIEYLNYGIIPIVLSERIGDFDDYHYEYIKLENIFNTLKPRKSIRNIEVVRKIYENNDFNLKVVLSKML